MNMNTKFVGLDLKNPLIVASGPLTGTGKGMVEASLNGAGAVITKTIVNEIRHNVRPRVIYKNKSVYNIELYSDNSLEQWEQEIDYAKKKGVKVIGSILGHTPSEIKYIGKKVESYGVDAIEMSLFSPHGEGLDGIVDSPKKLHEFTKALVDSVKVPVIVKLSANTLNIGKLAREAKRGGAASISGIDTIRAIPGVDIFKRKTFLPTYGGYSGEGIRPVSLAAVASMSQATNIPISGIGGITTGENVLEFLMLGATTVQVCSSIMINGYEHIKTIIKELEELMIKLNIANLEEIVGSALDSLLSFEEIPKEELVAFMKEGNDCKHCIGYCEKACLYGAIERNYERLDYILNKNLCTGCGLCIEVCPQNKFFLGHYSK